MNALVDVTINMEIKMSPEDVKNMQDNWASLLSNMDQYHKYVSLFHVKKIEMIPDSLDPMLLTRDYKVVHCAPSPSPEKKEGDLDNIHLL